jgi:hypothetical protein
MSVDPILGSVPTSFNDFGTALELNESNPPAMQIRIACADCGQGRFELIELLSGEYGAVGIEATCTQCGRTGSVFRASRDGYDGRLGHLHFLEPVTARQNLKDESGHEIGETSVACGVSYSIDSGELSALAADEASGPEDLFDWFVLYVRRNAGDPWRAVWEYECA